jgi:molecular chaperone DnaK
VPETGDSVEDVVHVLMPAATAEGLQREIETTEERVRELRRRGAGGPVLLERDLERAASTLLEARKGLEAAKGGDSDAAHRSLRLLLELNGELDAAEQAVHWPELEAEAHRAIQNGLSWVSARGTPLEQQMFQQAMAGVQEALAAGNSAQVDRQIQLLRSLANTSYNRDPEAPAYTFEWYRSHLSEASDIRRADELLKRGQELLRSRRLEELRQVNRELDALFPGTPDERRRSFGSGVS